MISRLLRFALNHKPQFAIALLLAVATVLTGIGLMSTSGYLISRAAQRPMLVDLFMVTAAVRFFGISRAVVRYFERIVSHDLTFKILSAMRIHLYSMLDQHPLAWLMGRKSGDLLTRLTSDIENLQNVYLRILSPVIVASIITTVTCTALWFFDPMLALSTFVFFALSGIAAPLLAIRLAAGVGRREAVLKSNMKAYLVDRLQGLQELRWMGRRQKTSAEFAVKQGQLQAINHKNAGIMGILEGLHTLAAHLGMFAALMLAIPLVLTEQIPSVMLAMLTLGVLSSFEAVQNLGNAFQHLGNYRESASRVNAVTASRQTVTVPEPEIKTPEKHDIEFQNVSFSYDDDLIALQNINLVLKQHTKTAIVGPVGSGKSTLVNLLLRFWNPQSGSILLHDTNIRHFDPEALRSLFAVVSQDAYIFNATLRENLLIAQPGASDRQLAEILEKVDLKTFASDFGLVLGDHGARLSGGERRLLALARAMLKDAPIWIFDEPTANLDVNTERRILDTIWATTGNRTQVMITHRLLDMEKMDQIVVMNRGRIIEQGTHRQLLHKPSFYARMLDYQVAFR